MYVKLKKIESNHGNLRTNVVEGLALELPESGKQFFMYADSLDGDGEKVRFVRTSVVQRVKRLEVNYLFYTENSVYELEVEDV